jgi:putative DNA primase/helicase
MGNNLDTESLREMALAYAGRGWRVFPLYGVTDGACTCYLKTTCEHPGKHPRTQHGFHDATTDAARITEWWEMWPISNIGIATGAVSGLVVIDIDWRNGAEATLAELTAAGRHLWSTAKVRTPGGYHLYYRHPGGAIGSTSNTLGPGIDIRADKGYVVAPPSIGAEGPYRWEVATEPVDL